MWVADRESLLSLTCEQLPTIVDDVDDIVNNTQINIFVARGVLIESQGPVWGYGTSSEHCVLYRKLD